MVVVDWGECLGSFFLKGPKKESKTKQKLLRSSSHLLSLLLLLLRGTQHKLGALQFKNLVFFLLLFLGFFHLSFERKEEKEELLFLFFFFGALLRDVLL
jgi:dolichol kinase